MIKEINHTDELYNTRTDEFLVISDSEDKLIDTEQMLKDLTDTLEANKDRLYICANEIGYNARAFVVRFDTEIKEFFNPVFQAKNNIKIIREIDPADGLEYLIPRFSSVTICYLDKSGKELAFKLNEDSSVIFGQAMDCINGLHDADYGLEIIPEFNEATKEEQSTVITEYIKELSRLNEIFNKELLEDEETKDFWQGYKYNVAVNSGEVEVETMPKPMNRYQRRLLNKLKKKFGGNK